MDDRHRDRQPGHLRGILAVLTVAGGCLLAAPAQASAQASTTEDGLCSSSVVIDQAGVLDVPQVEAAAALYADDFDGDVVVRVITYTRVPPGGDLYDALQDARAQCGGWGFVADGSSSLIVLGVAVEDRELGTHYDGALLDAFDASRDTAELESMGPHFGNGDWTAGMVAGLNAYRTLAVRYEADGTIEPGSGGTGDGTGLSKWALIVPVGGAGAGGGVYGAVALRRRRRRTAEARAAATTATGEMAQAWTDLEADRERLEARVTALPQVQDSAVSRIRADHEDASTAVESATQEYLAASETYATETVARMDADEASRVVAPVAEVTAHLRAAAQLLAAVEVTVSALDVLREQLPARTAALRASAEDLEGLITLRQGEGYRTAEFDAVPAVAYAAADEADRLAAGQRFGDAGAALDIATSKVAETTAWLSGLEQFRTSLATDLSALEERAHGLDAAIADAFVVTETLEGAYDSSCVEGVREQAEQARVDRTDLDRTLASIEQHASMTSQEFRLARTQVGEAQQACDTIAAGAAAPAERERELRELLVQLPSTAERLAADARDLGALIEANGAAVAHLGQLPAAGDLAGEAAALGERAAGSRPRLLELQAESEALSARLVAGRASVTAVIDDYETAQRALDSAVAAAAAAVEEAEDSDVSATVRSAAQNAYAAVTRAQDHGTLAEMTQAAVAAKAAADDAAADARREQREAQEARDDARRRAAARRTSSFSSGSSGSSRRSSGGGSRRSGGGGSRRSGGGGSRKF